MNIKELRKEFQKNQSRINGRKATREEKRQLRNRNREIWEIVGKLGNEKQNDHSIDANRYNKALAKGE